MDTLPLIVIDGLEVEQFASVEEAQAAFDRVPSYVERNAALFVLAASGLQIASESEE